MEWSVGSKATDGRRWQVSHVYGLSTWKFCLEKMVTFLLFAFILESKVNDSYLMVRMDCEKMNIETVIKADCLQLPFVIVAFYTLPAMVMVLLFLVSRYNKICILSTHQALSTGVSLHMFGCKDYTIDPAQNLPFANLSSHHITFSLNQEFIIILLMEEILHQLECITLVNSGINYLPTNWLAGFQPSTVSSYDSSDLGSGIPQYPTDLFGHPPFFQEISNRTHWTDP